MNASDNYGESDNKINQLQKELDELERKALEEIQKGTRNKFYPKTPEAPISDTENAFSEDLPMPPAAGSAKDENRQRKSSIEPPLSVKEFAEIHVQPNMEVPKRTMDISSNKTSKKIMIIGIILFIISLLSIGAYVLATQNGKNTATLPNPTSTPVDFLPTATPIQNPEQVKNTYLNSACHYSISYPTTWTVEKDNKTGFITVETPDFEGKVTANDYQISNGQAFGIYCETGDMSGLLDADGEIICQEDNKQGVTCEQLTFGNLSVVNNEKYKYVGIRAYTLYTFVVFDPGREVSEILESFLLEELLQAVTTPLPTGE